MADPDRVPSPGVGEIPDAAKNAAKDTAAHDLIDPGRTIDVPNRETQLDRVEKKLDRLLQILDEE